MHTQPIARTMTFPVIKRCLRLLAVGLCLAAASAHAQITAYDDAARTNYNGGWNNALNSGYGFGAWNLLQNNNPGAGDFSGFYTGSSGIGAVDVTNKSFGIYANGANYNYAIAYRTITNALTTSDVFSFKFKNNSIANGKVVGFSLFNNASIGGAPATNDFATLAGAAQFSFYFVGGNATYTLLDSGGSLDTGVPYHGDGLTLEFVLRAGNQYRFTVKSADGGTVYTNFDFYPLNNPGPAIDSFACYNLDNDTGSADLQVNQFKVAATALIPPVIANILPANGSVYLPTSTNISFNVSSVFSTIATNNVKVSLNGSNVTSYTFTGSSSSWDVTASPVLLANQTYNAVITATDNNGNSVTNNFTFNTWSASDLFIEAEAYNYSGGGAILAPFTGQYDAQAGIPGSNGVDFLEFVDAGTNFYRTNDAIDLEVSGDAVDHAGYVGLGLTNWTLSFVQFGEWANYTRRLTSGQAYNVYARMSGGGNNPVILAERDATPFATSTNQPRAAIGTFVGFNTGDIVSNYTFVALKDFFSNPVNVRFAQLTNTFRYTRIGDSYNLDYFIFVPITNTATQRPYLSAGFPFPNAANVAPDQQLTLTIANRQSTVIPASIQLFINGTNVTGSITTSNHNAGCTVAYTPASYYLLGATNTAQVIYTDSDVVTQTNTWSFTVVNTTVVPSAYALASATTRGFNGRIAKAPNEAPDSQFPSTSARAEAHLANLIINTNTSLPWVNEAAPGTFTEANVINYDQVGANGGNIPGDTLYPLVPAMLNGSYTNDPNHFSMAVSGYALLTPGIYKWGVRSDDSFKLTIGTDPTPTNLVLGVIEGGAGTSEFEFIIQTNGYYPIRLLHTEGNGFANIEFYSVNRTNGTVILINNLTNAAAVQVFTSAAAPATPVTLLNPAHGGVTSTFSFQTQAGKTHTVQYKNLLTDAVWQTLQTITGAGNITNVIDATANGTSRYYRVGTQ